MTVFIWRVAIDTLLGWPSVAATDNCPVEDHFIHLFSHRATAISSRVRICPQNEHALQWQALEVNDRRRGQNVLVLIDIDVRRKDSDQQGNDAPCGNS
jgi:hypothetical protein